jgi:hypothetical protein
MKTSPAAVPELVARGAPVPVEEGAVLALLSALVVHFYVGADDASTHNANTDNDNNADDTSTRTGNVTNRYLVIFKDKTLVVCDCNSVYVFVRGDASCHAVAVYCLFLPLTFNAVYFYFIIHAPAPTTARPPRIPPPAQDDAARKHHGHARQRHDTRFPRRVT